MLIEMSMDNPVFRELIDVTVRAAIAEYKKQMAELQPKWTSDLPTQEGWYWLKEDERTHCVFVRLEQALVFYEAMSEIDRCAALVEGEWYGPIEPPEYS